mmetsp:Transcript_6444/g.11178  ORF Transcript_6444/g.11178 Transcript_6444/m.11178 type:complete len:208 (+) Transcript_6444:505-1128(+)
MAPAFQPSSFGPSRNRKASSSPARLAAATSSKRFRKFAQSRSRPAHGRARASSCSTYSTPSPTRAGAPSSTLFTCARTRSATRPAARASRVCTVSTARSRCGIRASRAASTKRLRRPSMTFCRAPSVASSWSKATAALRSTACVARTSTGSTSSPTTRTVSARSAAPSSVVPIRTGLRKRRSYSRAHLPARRTAYLPSRTLRPRRWR